jgi:hypothetical protein
MRIHDLEESRKECISNLGKQEAEIAKLSDQEAVLTSQQIFLQLQLAEANRRSDGLENERTRAMTETQHSLHALQDSLSTLRSDLAKKEERDELARELENANIARKKLEASMSDAESEAHALYAKVQRLESEIKEARDTLLQLDIAQLEQPLPEALAQLGAIMQSVNAKRSEQVNQDSAQASTDTCFRTDQGTQTMDDAMHMNLWASEPITPVENCEALSPSDQAGVIVPFSSIMQGLEPTDCLTVENEPFDISSMLTQTPERVLSAKELVVPARPEKDSPFANVESQHKTREPQLYRASNIQRPPAEYVQEQIHQEAVVEQTPIQQRQSGAGRKVSFETRKSTAEDDDLQVPDSQVNGEPGLVVLSLNGSHPTRTNRWTYSKRQRETLTGQQKTNSCEAGSSQMDDREECGETGKNKKAKTCPALSNPVSQARTGAELYPRGTSPTRLASGSSRTRSSDAMSNQTGQARRLRKSARQTRGKFHPFACDWALLTSIAEKYNARFSQGA